MNIKELARELHRIGLSYKTEATLSTYEKFRKEVREYPSLIRTADDWNKQIMYFDQGTSDKNFIDILKTIPLSMKLGHKFIQKGKTLFILKGNKDSVYISFVGYSRRDNKEWKAQVMEH